MARTKIIDYYLSLVSPWAYLGHDRLMALAQNAAATINIWPVDFGAVFPATGGLPLPKRAPARRAYRMQELKRWRAHLNIELTLEPKYFPTDDKPASALLIVLRSQDPESALRFASACLRAVWVEERDITDHDTLLAIGDKLDLDTATLLTESQDAKYLRIMAQDSQDAIERGVFGAPSYIYQDELFWGQDRLDFLQRALSA